MSPSVLRLLLAREYPGNVRDLRQLAVRVAARHTGDGPVTLGDIPKGDRLIRRTSSDPRSTDPAPTAPDSGDCDDGTWLRDAARRLMATGRTLPEATRILGDEMVDVALEEAGGGTRAAARLLGVSERAVQMRRAAQRSAILPDEHVVSPPPAP